MLSNKEIREVRYRYFLDIVKGQDTRKILDIGSHTGELCNVLKQLGHEPYGIEIAEDTIAQARRRYPDIVFRTPSEDDRIPFEDEMFDIVWAGEVIEHVAHTDVFVNEINRVLKTGGVLVLTTPLHNTIKNILIALFNFENHYNPEFPHYRFYTLKSLRSVLARRGLEITIVDYLGRVPILAECMGVMARKIAAKQVMSEHRY